MKSQSFNRIDLRFKDLRARGRKAFAAFIMAGDPDLKRTGELALALQKVGVDILELGVPFSDPLADGVVNQLAAARALKSGTTLKGVLQMVARTRRHGLKIPVVLYVYFNLVHCHGVSLFVEEAAAAGVDGVLFLDLPPEESNDCSRLMEMSGLHPIHLISPTTPPRRIAQIARKARGFIYYVSLEGVTGMRKKMATGIAPKVREIRRFTRTPIVVGFGISTPQQVRAVSREADGCVVGSAIVNQIAKLGKSSSLVPQVAHFAGLLVNPNVQRSYTPKVKRSFPASRG